MEKSNIKSVVFVSPYPHYAKDILEPTSYPPMGIAYMAGFLESKGLKCHVIDAYILKMTNEDVFKKITELKPDMVGISTNVVTIREGCELSEKIKDNLNIRVVLGGAYAASTIGKILEKSKADCIIVGEGDSIIWNLVDNGFDLPNTKGAAYLEQGEVKVNPREIPIEDLDSLPFPAWHLLPDLKLYKSKSRRTPVVTMLTSRGCPYKCIFCSSSSKNSVFGPRFRTRSPENVVKEIEYVTQRFGVKQIDILDDNFTLNLERAGKILDLIVEKKIDIAISFPNGVRADRLTKELVHKMKLAGTYRVGIGIESGDEEILKILKKSLDLETVLTAIKWFREENIIVSGFFMLGLPHDTPETMQKTIDFAIKSNPHIANFSMAIPMIGTEMYEIVKKEGTFIKSTEDGLSTGYNAITEGYFEFKGFKKEDVLKYQRLAYKKFYLRPSKMLELLLSIRTMDELRWLIHTSYPLLKGIFNPKNIIKIRAQNREKPALSTIEGNPAN